jgi:outer membrane protein OmpA-like peptidoglycan-associated protein
MKHCGLYYSSFVFPILKITLTVFITFAISLDIYSQTLSAYERAADQAFENADYYNAVYYYENILKSKPKPSIYYKFAESCRMSFAYKKAEEAYLKVLESKERERFIDLEFNYALTLKHNGKYDQAAEFFKIYIEKTGIKEKTANKAKKEIESCSIAKVLLESDSKDSVLLEKLGDNVNTEFSDFAAHESEDGSLYYSSLRFDRKTGKKKKEDKRFITKLLFIKTLKDKAKPLVGLNSDDFHSANSCFSSDGKRIYFTRCNGDNNDSVVCKIYYSVLQSNGSWSRPFKMAAPINIDKYSFTQPNIASIKGEEHLFFASNRPGGMGGMDIWIAKFLSDSVTTTPQNLGIKINSSENEASPFYQVATRRLFFSSQWHSGLGGYDIFYAEKLKDNKWSEPVNLGLPFNSAANDLYFILNKDDSTGYFASNRLGSKTITEESCCNDIYSFAYLKKPERTDTIEINIPKDSTPVITLISVPADSISISKIDNDTVPQTEEEHSKNIRISLNKIKNDSLTTEEKIELVNQMLPLKLYFSNDEPDSNVTVNFTNKYYQLCYEQYMNLKYEYIKEYSEQYKGEQRIQAAEKVENFFDSEVVLQYNRMNAFLEALYEVLKSGVKIEVQIRGFTSPRAPSDYNVALANRRIMSVRKQFSFYKKGIFWPFLKSGILTIQQLPFGETTAPSGISDAYEDPRNSVYSVEASRERRVEIVLIILR